MKLAMIGSYGHCNIVLDSLRAGLEDVELAAVAKHGEDDGLWFYGGDVCPDTTPKYDDYQKMLDEVKPDVVSVCTPLYRLAETSIAAAEHGCHIISEKPLATTLEDPATLKKAVDDNGVKICAMFQTRTWSPFLAARQAVVDGKIGEPVLVFAQKSYPWGTRDDYYRERKTYGGTIPWVAIHALGFASFCSGKGYKRVSAMHSNYCHPDYPGAEDNGGILLELTGGGTGIVSFDYLRPKGEGVQRAHGDDRLRIVGTEGIVEIVDDATRTVLMTPTEVIDLPLPEPRDLFGEFVSSIRGTGECIVTAEESFGITEVALKARESADTGVFLDI